MANPGGVWPFVGLFLCAVETTLIAIAFFTPYWVYSDNDKVVSTQLESIGLWEACFKGYTDTREPGRNYNGCEFIFAREYSQIRRWLLPSWFVTTQALMTCNLVLTLANNIFDVVLVFRCFPTKVQKWATAVIAISHYTIGLFIMIACIYFGTNADTDRNWLKYPHLRSLGWSYYQAIFGGIAALLSAMCYSVFFMYIRKSEHSATAYRAHEMRHYRDR